MNEEQLKAALQAELKDFKANLNNYAEKADLDKRFKELSEKVEGIKTDELICSIEELKSAVEKQGLEMQRLNEGKETLKTLRDLLVENQKAIKDAASSKRSHSFVYKTDVTRASVGSSYQAMRLPDIGQLPYGSVGLNDLFRQAGVSPNSNGVIRYIDQLAATRNADAKAEAAQYPESAITWQEYSLNIEKIVDSIPVTMEALNDVDFIESEIRRLLEVNLAIKLNSQFWSGTGNTPQIDGIYTQATAFDPAAYTISSKLKVKNATLYDLLAVLKVEISNAKESKYAPDFVVMNPSDILRMKLAKSELGEYVIPPFTMNNGQQVDGMTVYENSVVTVNTMLLGDRRYATTYNIGGVELEVGIIDKQFIEDMVTIKAKKRTALLVRNVDLDAFLKVTDITTAIAAIDAGA